MISSNLTPHQARAPRARGHLGIIPNPGIPESPIPGIPESQSPITRGSRPREMPNEPPEPGTRPREPRNQKPMQVDMTNKTHGDHPITTQKKRKKKKEKRKRKKKYW